MIGAEYAQFTSFIPADTALNEDGGEFLPSHLLPSFFIPRPWPSLQTSGFQEDFIMVAEFSEIEGPKPVLLIPKNGGNNFDLNTFAVKIMAVDRQSCSVGFSISEDTQVSISEDEEEVYSFVHHFILYDHQARGFVRPFCMVFVTTERGKIMNFYEELSTQFHKVARFLKYGNRMVFVCDLERHLNDLEYTKGHLRVRQSSNSENRQEGLAQEEEQTYHELQNIRTSMSEVKEILSVLRPLLNDRRVEGRFKILEERAWQEEYPRADTNSKDRISLQENRSSPGTGDLYYRCGSYNEGSTTPLSLFHNRRAYTPKIIPADRRKKFDCALRGLHDLCSWGAKEGLKKLRCIHEHYKRNAMILEVERCESDLLDPPGSLMTCGSCVTSNFLTGVSMRGLDLSMTLVDTPLSTPGVEILRRWPSNDTLDSFKSVGSFFSLDDYDDEVISLMSARSNSMLSISQSPSTQTSPIFTSTKYLVNRRGNSFDSDTASYHTDEAASVVDSLASPIVDSWAPPRVQSPQTSVNNSGAKTNEHGEGDNCCSLSHRQELLSRQVSVDTSCSDCSKCVSSLERESELDVMASPDRPTNRTCDRKEHYHPPDEGLLRTSSGEDNGPISGASTPLARKPKAGLYSLGDLLEKLGPGIPGFGFVDMVKSCDSFQHVLYSLLIGRTVLIVGTSKLEAEVSQLVTALAVFLPDHRRKHSSFIEWSSKCLKLSDLSRVKLIGICRPEKKSIKNVVPNVVKKYSTVIDLDRQVIIAPRYKGTMITNIINKRKFFKTNSDFISCIHCWLMEISSKAFIFYHSFCLGTAGSIMYDYSLQNIKSQYQSTVKSFIAKLGVGEHDIPIIEYLAEVVKISEIEPHMRHCRNGGCSALPISLTYLPCQVFSLRS